jgi:hypothetical protein
MDESILAKYAIPLREPCNGFVEGYRLRIGKNATLLREKESVAYGIVCRLTHQEIHRLYIGAGLHQYVPESIMVMFENGDRISALCYVLLDPPALEEKNPAYYKKLISCMTKLNLPILKRT